MTHTDRVVEFGLGLSRAAFPRVAQIGKGWTVALLLGAVTLLLSMIGCDLSPSSEPVFKFTGAAFAANTQTIVQRSQMTYTLTLLNTNDTWGYVDPCG